MDLVVYVRTSTAHGGNGDSPAAQEDACRAWATAAGHDVATVHIDRGLSGKLGPNDRPGLAAALVAVEQGDADGVVVHRLDRLARELHVQEAALARAWEAGGRVFEAVEGEVPRDDPDDPYRRFVRQVMGAAAELERGMIAARLRTGRRRKRERGGYTGGPAVPFGQRVEGEGRDARLVDDPRDATTVADILQLRRAGLTLAAIAGRLNAEGIPSLARVERQVRPPAGRGALALTVPPEKYGKTARASVRAKAETGAVPKLGSRSLPRRGSPRGRRATTDRRHSVHRDDPVQHGACVRDARVLATSTP